MDRNDTIAAICTGTGGAISIVRVSGDRAAAVAAAVRTDRQIAGPESARQMQLTRVALAGGGSDTALVVFMPGPHSYTGDDIVEIHCHGGNLIGRRVLENILQHGARMAEPGEFTYRAFLNGKMDLTQAEAVADLIGAGSDRALRLAERQASGQLGSRIRELRAQLVDLLADCESRLDFAEEHLDWQSPAAVNAQLQKIADALSPLLASSREGAILRQGIRIVIAGRPNAGKSSLLNLLLGYERAIVTAIPGTTRDTLEEAATLRGIPVRLTDTAGIRDTAGEIEELGIDRSKQSMRQAQLILWLLDAAGADRSGEVAEMKRQIPDGAKVIAVWNKIDCAASGDYPSLDVPAVTISVLEVRGIETLLDAVEKAVWEFPHEAEPEIAVSSRHADALRQALEALPPARERVAAEEWELAAVHLREAVAALGAITGENADPDLLANIFSRFCIGK